MNVFFMKCLSFHLLVSLACKMKSYLSERHPSARRHFITDAKRSEKSCNEVGKKAYHFSMMNET